MHLVAAEPLRLVGVEGFAVRLLAEEPRAIDFLFALLEPEQNQNLALKELSQPIDVPGSVLVRVVRSKGTTLV